MNIAKLPHASCREGDVELSVIVDQNENQEVRGFEVYSPRAKLGELLDEYLVKAQVHDVGATLKYSRDVDILYIKIPDVPGKSIIQKPATALPLVDPMGKLVGFSMRMLH